MNAIQEAKQLYSEYRFALSIPNAPLGEAKDHIAKQLAMREVESKIVENESILAMAKIHMDERAVMVLDARIFFLRNVKEEIQKL